MNFNGVMCFKSGNGKYWCVPSYIYEFDSLAYCFHLCCL